MDDLSEQSSNGPDTDVDSNPVTNNQKLVGEGITRRQFLGDIFTTSIALFTKRLPFFPKNTSPTSKPPIQITPEESDNAIVERLYTLETWSSNDFLEYIKATGFTPLMDIDIPCPNPIYDKLRDLHTAALRGKVIDYRREMMGLFSEDKHNSASPPPQKEEVPGGITRREFLYHTGIVLPAIVVLAALGLSTAGCSTTTTVTDNKERLFTKETLGTTEEGDIDGAGLLEMETWSPDDFLAYMHFAGIGGLMTYTATDAILNSDPRYDNLRVLLAAANNRENRNYRVDMNNMFDPNDNTITHASDNIISPQSLATPKQFGSRGVPKHIDTWAKVEFQIATTGEATDPLSGGRTIEYLPSEKILTGVDISSGNHPIRFIGEPRSSRQVVIEITNPAGQPVKVLAPRNLIFPNFNQDRGYRVILPDGTEKIFTHLEARHPIGMDDVRNLVQSIGSNVEVDYLVKGVGERGPLTIGLRTPHNGQVHEILLKTDETILTHLNQGNPAEVIKHIQTLPQDRVITAYDSFDRINGISDEALALHRRIRGVYSLNPETIVYEVLPDGAYLRLPAGGPGIVRWASRLGGFLRKHPTMSRKVGGALERIAQNRVKLKLTASIVGAVLEVIATEAAKVALDVYEAATIYDQIRAIAVYATSRSNAYGEYIAPSLDKYYQGFLIDADISDPETGMVPVNQAFKLPPLMGLPTDATDIIPGLIFFNLEPIDKIPENSEKSIGEILKEQLKRTNTILFVEKHVYNQGVGGLNFLYARQNHWKDPYPLGFPCIPTNFGENPKHIGVYVDESGDLCLCIIDYATNSGLGERLGKEFSTFVSVAQIQDVVNYYGSFQQTLKHITPSDIDTRTGNYVITYSIINNNQIAIQVNPI